MRPDLMREALTTPRDGVADTMRWVMVCTLPGIALQTSFFGIGVVIQIVLCVFFCAATETLCLVSRKRDPRRELRDFSALLSALLLGLCLPPLAPWWCALIGSFFAMTFGKHLYGGLGLNPFNPAMIGYIVLLIAFPLSMTAWTPATTLQPYPADFSHTVQLIFNERADDGLTLQSLRHGIDGFTLATPLDTLKNDLSHGLMTRESFSQHSVYGTFAGLGWEWVNVAFLLGGCVLLWRKVISWRIPVATLSSLFICATFFYVWNPDGFASPLFHLFSGATMLSAFFIATDPVTASTTPKGRLFYGVGIGMLVYIIRQFGGYPDAFAFAILLMNCAAPLIDHYTVPASASRYASE